MVVDGLGGNLWDEGDGRVFLYLAPQLISEKLYLGKEPKYNFLDSIS